MVFYRPTWVEVSKSIFSANIRQLKKSIGSKTRLLAVLKADGYGHGAIPLSSIAMNSGAFMLGVSSLEEGIALREAGVMDPILLLGGIFPLENFAVAIQYRLTPTVASFESARYLRKASLQLQSPVAFHLKVDTGMGRIGVSPDGAKRILQWIRDQRGLVLAGLFSHFSCADGDKAFTFRQLALFDDLKKFARQLGFRKTLFHMANSAATLAYRETHEDMVRTGLAIYGIPAFKNPHRTTLNPVLSWQTKAIFFKKVRKGTPISYGRTYITKRSSDIITLPVGYADGIPRAASNKASVLVKGKRCPVVGTVTMDHIMVDVTGLGVTVGEKVTLIGQQGRERIGAADWATWAGSIPYEIICGISKRVPRVMVP